MDLRISMDLDFDNGGGVIRNNSFLKIKNFGPARMFPCNVLIEEIEISLEDFVKINFDGDILRDAAVPLAFPKEIDTFSCINIPFFTKKVINKIGWKKFKTLTDSFQNEYEEKLHFPPNEKEAYLKVAKMFCDYVKPHYGQSDQHLNYLSNKFDILSMQGRSKFVFASQIILSELKKDDTIVDVICRILAIEKEDIKYRTLDDALNTIAEHPNLINISFNNIENKIDTDADIKHDLKYYLQKLKELTNNSNSSENSLLSNDIEKALSRVFTNKMTSVIGLAKTDNANLPSIVTNLPSYNIIDMELTQIK